ncbi:MAG: DUF1549 domain-containing protein [Gemmataceae bacterium]
MPFRASLILLMACVLPGSAEAPVSFQRDVAPLLRSNCLQCHSGSRLRGDLDLTRRETLLAGGISGPAIQPGKPEKSPLFTHVRDHKMPPKKPLASGEVEILRRWVADGARWEGGTLTAKAAETSPTTAGKDWWSLQPIRRPTLPITKSKLETHSVIDAFLLAKLREKGLDFSPEADRRALLRRVSFDLTGLAPTPEEVEAFVQDARPDAYERLVDRLLASPHYGERWGRHWLDVVRFAESHGYEMNTLRPNAWPSRDYVIRAFNQDLPYGRFIREQLAGDVDEGNDFLTQSATGFLVAGAHDLVGNETT